MRQISIEELNYILKQHYLWLKNDGGVRADLSCVDLTMHDLRGVDLRWANLMDASLINSCLIEADLSDAILHGSNLRMAKLMGANLMCANLIGVDLSCSNLSYSNLSKACLIDSNLCDADLIGSDLSYADLKKANLFGANLSNSCLIEADLSEAHINWPIACPEKGSFIGFKKAITEISNYVVELEIQADSERCSATSRKCRCSKAKVISITNLDGSQADIKEVVSSYDKTFKYKIGEIVEVANFDPNRWNECSTGIHFFITRQEAVDY